MKLTTLKKIAIASSNYDDKIYIAELYANLMIGNCDLKYDDNEFEKELISSFEWISDNIELPNIEPTSSICHVISTPYLEGGHTRLCENLAKIDDCQDSLLITRSAKNNVIDRLNKFFSEIHIIKSKNNIDKIKEIISFLIKFDKIILHIHPDDILTIISIGLLKKKSNKNNIFFVNHADHIFSFGRSVIDVMLLISYRGYEIENKNSYTYKLSYLGIPININKLPTFKKPIENLLIAGSSYKMKPSSTISIQKEIDTYMSKHRKINLTVIGAKFTDYWWWPIKLKYWSRVKMYDLLSYPNYMEILDKCDSCIDTAPSTGGTAFAEMYLNNLRPLAIYSGIYGYTPLDAIRGHTLEESYIKSNDRQLDELFDELDRIHNPKHVGSRYRDSLEFHYHKIPTSLTKLQNNLSLYSNPGKKTINLDMMKKIRKIKSMSFTDKINILAFNVNMTDFILKNIIKIKNKIINLIKNN
ncbi:hypothetical protein ABN222_17320 [Providencia alcalifaciens]